MVAIDAEPFQKSVPSYHHFCPCRKDNTFILTDNLFLLEAATLSLAGGGIGIAVGVLVSKGISWVITFMDIGFSIEAVVSPFIVILAVSVSVIIGLASGIYPAMRAARLNSIDALNYE